MSTLFLTTGYEKSGTSWFEAMLWSLDGIGGYAPTPDAGMPITADWLLHDRPLLAVLAGVGISPARALELLLRPAGVERPGPVVPADKRDELLGALAGLLSRCRRMRDTFDPSRAHSLVSPQQLLGPLLGEPAVREGPAPVAVGCPSKHLPTGELLRTLPAWHVIRIVRDPRDILVSRFYHAMGHIAADIERFADLDGPEPRPHADWQARFFGAHAKRLLEWFNLCRPREARHIDPGETNGPQIVVRYEDLLIDAPGQLARVTNALGLSRPPTNLDGVCRRLSFASITGGTAERRNSFIRKGQSGDWRNYFTRSLAGVLPHEFTSLLIDLGYEPQAPGAGPHPWMAELPDAPPTPFDFSRFRIKQAAAHRFMPLWQSRPELQERFPVPLDVRGDDSFADWLSEQPEPDIRRWWRITSHLAERWGAHVEETAYH